MATWDNPEAVVPSVVQLLSTMSRTWEPAQLRFMISAGGSERPSAEWQIDADDTETATSVAMNLKTIANAVLVDIRVGDPVPMSVTDDALIGVADFVASRQARVEYVRAVSSAWRACREDSARWTLSIDIDALLSGNVGDDVEPADPAYPEEPTPATVPVGVRLVGARIRLSSWTESSAAGAITALFSEDTTGPYGLQSLPVTGPSAPLTWLPVGLAAHLLAGPARMMNAFPAPATPPADLFVMFERAATPHLLILGSTGQGKTVFLSRLVHRACELGEAPCVVDVHDGWLHRQALQFTRAHGMKPVIADFTQPSRAPRIRLVTAPPGVSRRQWADELWDIVRHLLWADMPAEYFGPVGERGLRALIRMAVLDPDDATDLHEIAALITESGEADRRREILSRIGDPELQGIVENEIMPMVTGRDAGNSATWLLSKLSPLVDSWAVRAQTGKGRAGKADSLDVERAVRTGRPFLLLAPTTSLGDSGSRLVVSIALRRLWLAARRRTTAVPLHLIVDEWQLYPSTTIAAMLSQGRKYGLRMRLANQNLSQLSADLRDSVLGNSGSVVCFRVGPADAMLLDGLFPTVPRYRLQTLPPHTFAVTFGDRDLITAAPPPLSTRTSTMDA